ncbi:MAG: 16S rRNA (guanine(527)-N(7))-methyltransferase RsmG [Pseudomonadota bacterium]
MPAIDGPEAFAAAFGVSRETIDRLVIYADLLKQWQKAVNLVAPSTLDALWHRHFADSAQLLALAPPTATRWLDLGSGGGFPGLVLAILLAGRFEHVRPTPPSPRERAEGWGDGRPPTPRPLSVPNPLASLGAARGNADRRDATARPIRVTLVESDSRKAAFLREVVRQTGLAATPVAVDILSARIESITTQGKVESVDVITARALAPLEQLFRLAAPVFGSATVGLFLKGREVGREVAAARRSWEFSVELAPSATDADGRVAVVRRLRARAEG